MDSRNSRPAKRPVSIALCLMALTLAVALVCAATSRAADFRTVLCSANNGSNGFTTTTNTTSPQNPGGIFNFENYCGPAPFPAGDQALLRIQENQPSGNAGQGAYGDIYYDTPPFVHFREAGGFTRQPGTFNDGWRERFWIAGGSAGNYELLSQGQGAPQGTTPYFSSHLWPVGGYLDFTRFVFELSCVRPAGCDRSGGNAADANSFVFTLADEWPSRVQLTSDTPLMQGGWVRGVQVAAYQFTEFGSGIRAERIRIDGSEQFTVDHAHECDTDSNGATGLFARSFQPCALAPNPIGRTDTFNTATLADGAHTLQACAQDFAQWQGVNGSGGESCDQRTIHTDNTAPGAPLGLQVTSANPARYLDHFGARFSLPPDPGSPITKVHYDVINAAGTVVVPEHIVAATNPTELTGITGPAQAGDYRLRVWPEDEVGFTGPAAVAQIPHDTTPPAAAQGLSVATPQSSRKADGFDVRWRNLVDSGSPIDAAHYQVLDASGKVVVATHDLGGEGIQSIASLDAPKAQGDGTLRLWLSDAEGNVGAPVSAPLSYDCVRSDVGGGTGISAAFADAPNGSVLVDEGHGETLVGKVQGLDGPGAAVCVFSRVVTDQDRQFLGVAMTGQGGGYQFAVAAGPSRELTSVYRPDQRELSASAMLRTTVHPTFKLRQKVIHNKHFGVFMGSIPGPGNGNVIVVVRVKDGKKWRAIRRYRTREDGRFIVRYRFTHTNRPTTYVTKAEVGEQSGYPYAAGESDPAGLRVLP